MTTTERDDETTRAKVRETYGAIAREGGSCCGPGGCAPADASKRIGYSEARFEQACAPSLDARQRVVGCEPRGCGCGDATTEA